MAHYALHPKRTKFKRTKGSAAERSRSSLAARYAVRYAVHDAVLYVPYLNAVERSGARLAACYEVRYAVRNAVHFARAGSCCRCR